MRLIDRAANPQDIQRLQDLGAHPLLARLFAARGARSLINATDALLAPSDLKGAPQAAALLADAIAAGQRLCIVADYDCDGATSCAVALRGLRMFGGNVRFHVPNRFRTGYGLSPKVVDEVVQTGGTDWIITVDNGIASVDGVAHAQAQGMRVLVTDHHLPGQALPSADCIVNPNQPGCTFASKNLAGVGVMYYVLLALRDELLRRGVPPEQAAPDLESLLSLVSLGTVADVVALDDNNRTLVAQGLRRIRAGKMPPGMRALFAVAKRNYEVASTADFGFALGPRINAAGRLDDMTVGILCLTTEDAGLATQYAQNLDTINRERKSVEKLMRAQAEVMLAQLPTAGHENAAICLFSPQWHEGVVGIVAGRFKELYNRPTFAFAQADDGSIRGSGRSIPGFHLRDALDLVSKRSPGLLLKFGGHAMAAGCSVRADGVEEFTRVFTDVAKEWLTPELLDHVLPTDADIPQEWFTPEVVSLLDQQVWGQGFPPPVFSSAVEVLSQGPLGSAHLKARVRVAEGPATGAIREIIAWNRTAPLPAHCRIAWRLDANEWNGRVTVRGILDAVESMP